MAYNQTSQIHTSQKMDYCVKHVPPFDKRMLFNKFVLLYFAGGRHFSSWERTTQFGNQAMSSLITTVEKSSMNGNGNKSVPKPVLKPIPSRLGSPLTMIKYEPKMFQDLSPHSNNGSIKLGKKMYFHCY